jgi:hypothetical protein
MAQEVAKTLEWEDHRNPNNGRLDPTWAKRIDALELEDISIDGKSLLVGEPFLGDMRRIVFRVKNISDKAIGFVQITLTLPELKDGPIQIPFVLPRVDGNKATPILPGAEADLRLPDDQKFSDWVRDSAARRGKDLQAIRRVSIYAVFSSSETPDHTMAGSLKTRDARNECPYK